MPLSFLRRRLHLWIQRPIGQLAGLLLMVAMLSAGTPTASIHAHTDGDRDHGHGHAAQVVGDDLPDQSQDPASSDSPGDMVYHAHDVGTTASALPTLLVMVPRMDVPMAPSVSVAEPPPPSAARIPPHRPPIV